MNYTELTSALQDYLQDEGTSFVANIPTFVKQAEDRLLYNVPLPVFQKNATSTLTIGSHYVALPTDFLAPNEFSVTNASGQNFMLQKAVSFIREAYPLTSVSGLPRYYALFDHNTAILGPTPDQAYVVELHYFYRPASIVDSATSWLGDNAPAALLYGSLVEAYTFLKGEADLVTLYQSRYAESLQALQKVLELQTKAEKLRETYTRVN